MQLRSIGDAGRSRQGLRAVGPTEALEALGVAVIGFGVSGRQHAEALSGARFAEVRTVLEPDPSVDTGAFPRSTDWMQVLTDPTVGLVALCVPPGARAAMAEQALRAGKAVLLERPPAASPTELDRIVGLGRQLGLPVGVMLQERLRIPESLLSLDWGAGASAVLEVSRFRPRSYFLRPGRERGPAGVDGVLAQSSVDYLDLACQLLGEPERTRTGGRRRHGPGIDSRVAGVVEFRSGAVLTFVLTSESTVRTERLDVLGTDLRLLIADGAVTTHVSGTVDDHPLVSTGELKRAVYEEMTWAVASGRPPVRCALSGARGVSTILQAIAGQSDPDAV